MKKWLVVLAVGSSLCSVSHAFDFFGLFTAEEKQEQAEEQEVEKVSPLDEDTPMAQTEVAGGKSFTETRAFRPPDYTGQEKALGYNANVFDVPKGMEKQVAFWTDIYSKYTTDQGVIHDTEWIEVVYAEIDFKDIVNDTSINIFQKERKKQKLVDEKKKDVLEALKKLEKVSSPEGLNDFEKRIWTQLQQINEPDKFKEAASKNRIRFQLGQKDRMQSAIFFSGRYLENMEKIFKEEGLPIELTRLVFVESSFNVLARSKVGASGLWQIMRYTARPYRMMTNAAVDLRNHPMAATKLAARLMKDNYRLLNAWPLALTGYNHGPTGVRKLTEKYKTRELPELIQNVKSRASFGFASRNFYACFLAALEVERNAQKYFPKIVWSQLLEGDEIKIPINIRYKDLVTWFDGNDEKTQVFNPHLTRQARNQGLMIPAKTMIAIPRDRYNQALISLARGEFRYAANMNPEIKAAPENPGPEIREK